VIETRTDGVATVVIGQHVVAGRDEEYARWGDELNAIAGSYPGFLGAEVHPPTSVQADWVTIFRFDSLANLQTWLNSATRLEHLAQARELFDGPATQQVLSSEGREDDSLVTVVLAHKVPPDREDEFLAWQNRVTSVERSFDGFRGMEMFRPIEGVQDEWTTIYRFDTAAHLDAWLLSDARERLLESNPFPDYDLRKVDSSFGNWFSFDLDGNEVAPPSDLKSSLGVWLGLYPTVVLLSLAMSPLQMPFWAGLLLGNFISCFIMSYLTMPRYVNPILGWWLRPDPGARQPATNVKGLALIVGINVVWAIVFYVVTVRIWTLP
jgi:antibiotic biosynthesis monooxygenase (ABM) superfamily enzyme